MKMLPRPPFKSLVSRLLLVGALVGCGSGAALEARPPEVRTLVAMGASDVVGVGATHPETEGWAPALASVMPSGTRVVRVGVSGWQAHQVLELGVPQAVKAQPDTVVLWVGVNDFLAQKPLSRFEADLGGILHQVKPAGSRVLVLNLPDLDRLPAFQSQASTMRRELPAWQQSVRTLAHRHSAEVVDLASYSGEVVAHPEYVSADGFHPSTAGYRRLAEIIRASL